MYDYVLQAIINELSTDPAQHELGRWLHALLPGPDDIDELGYGAWLRAADQETIMRYLDMRQLAEADQDAVCQAALRASQVAPGPDGYATSVADFAAMVRAYQRGEPPLSNSDWTRVEPAEECRVGPGWKCDVEWPGRQED